MNLWRARTARRIKFTGRARESMEKNTKEKEKSDELSHVFLDRIYKFRTHGLSGDHWKIFNFVFDWFWRAFANSRAFGIFSVT